MKTSRTAYDNHGSGLGVSKKKQAQSQNDFGGENNKFGGWSNGGNIYCSKSKKPSYLRSKGIFGIFPFLVGVVLKLLVQVKRRYNGYPKLLNKV